MSSLGDYTTFEVLSAAQMRIQAFGTWRC